MQNAKCKMQETCFLPPASCFLLLAACLLLLASCTSSGRPVYQEVAAWLDAHALPTERVAVPLDARKAFGERETITLSGGVTVFALSDILNTARPDYLLAWRGVAWDSVRAQPWFIERYHPVAEWRDANDTASPWTLYTYTPSPFDAGARVPLDVTFGDTSFMLRAYRLSSPRVTPNAPLYLTLYWADAGHDFTHLIAAIQLSESASGRVVAHAEEVLHVSDMAWTPDDRLAAQYTLIPPDDAPDGLYSLSVAVTTPGGKPLAPSTDTAQDALTLATLERPPDVSRAPIAMDYPADFTLGDAIALRGYDAPTRLAPGDTLRVALLWHALAAPADDYKVFVHLLTAAGEAAVQDDSKPVYWFYPTTDWQAGDYVRDGHVLALPADLPRGDYTLAIGMYLEATGDRLPAYDANGTRLPDDRVVLKIIQVR